MVREVVTRIITYASARIKMKEGMEASHRKLPRHIYAGFRSFIPVTVQTYVRAKITHLLQHSMLYDVLVWDQGRYPWVIGYLRNEKTVLVDTSTLKQNVWM